MIEKLKFDNGEEINMEVWERMLCKMNHPHSPHMHWSVAYQAAAKEFINIIFNRFTDEKQSINISEHKDKEIRTGQVKSLPYPFGITLNNLFF